MNFNVSPARLRYPYQKGPIRSVTTEETDQDVTYSPDRLFERTSQMPQDWNSYPRAKSAPDFNPGSYNDADMNQSNDQVLSIDANKKRVISAPTEKAQLNYAVASSSDGSGGNNLSTDGKELYDANSYEGSIIGFNNNFRPVAPPSADSQSSNLDIEVAEFALDDDVLWVLDAHAKLNLASPPKSPDRVILGRKSPSDWQQQLTSFQQIQESDHQSPLTRGAAITPQLTSPQLPKEKKQRATSNSKPHSSAGYRRSPFCMSDNSNNRTESRGRPPKSASAAFDAHKDQGSILHVSKSMPLMPPLAGGSIAQSKGVHTLGSSSEQKTSVKGLTKGDFDNMSMHSPYLEHLKKGSPFAGLTNQFEIHRAIFAKKTKKNGSKPPKTKAYAVMSEEKNQFDRRQMSGMQRSLLPPPTSSSVADSNKDFLAELKPFTPMTSKHIEVKSNGLRPDRQPDDLYMRSKMLFQQMEPSRSCARIVDGQGHVIRPLTGASMANNDEDGRGSLMNNTNTLSAFHSSTELILRTSPSNLMLNESKGINSIDRLVTTQQLPHGQLLRPIPRSPNTDINELFIQQTKQHQQEPAVTTTAILVDAENRFDSMDMLANIHIDPLYRIIREEMDRIQALPTTASPSSNPSPQPISQQRQHSELIIPAHIKVLCYFQALPPAVWVTCRLVYFLLTSYYETVLKKTEYEAFRQATGLEQLWSILEYHHEKENMSIATTAKLFSWPYLRELFKFPLLVCKALDLIENGLRMNAADWQTMIRRSYKLDQGEKDETIAITDELSSRAAFYDVFPVSGFTPLRDMVKAARGFLLTHSSVLFGGSTYGSPLVPGSPLAISAALTAWVKRVIALLYISGTQRVRSLKSSLSAPNLHGTETEPAATKLRPKTPQQLMAPPSLSFRCLVDSALSVDQRQSNLTMMYFAAGCSLVKPADQLEVLLLSSSSSFQTSQQSYGMTDQAMTTDERLRSELESFLRSTSASPLHRISIFNRAAVDNNEAVTEDPATQEVNILAASMHPALRTENEGQKFEVLVMPLFSVNGVEPFIDGSRLLTETQRKLIRSQLDFSLALVPPISKNAGNPTMRGNRYIVAVTDSTGSWQAFQMACRLAKDSDLITIVHVPTLRLADAIDNTQSPQASMKTLSALNAEHFRRMHQAALQRQENILSLYRQLGYNVLCSELPKFLSQAQWCASTSAQTKRWKVESMRCLGPETGGSFDKMYEYYQVNEEMRRMARQLLRMIIPLQPDHLLVGADADDILHALSCKYLNEYFSFSVEGIDRRQAVNEDMEAQQQSQLPPQQVHIGQQLEVSTAGGTSEQEMMLLDGEEMLGDGYDEDFALFEERAVILPGEALLGNGNSGSNDYEGDGFEEDDELSFRNRSLPEEQQQRILPATELVTLGYQQRHQTAGTSTAPSDYEQDSFIVEDNDEGDLSLPASSNNGIIVQQQQQQQQQVQLRQQQREQEQDRLIQLQMFRDYARAPATFMDMLMHEAVCMDDWCEVDDEMANNNQDQQRIEVSALLPSVEARFALLNAALPTSASSRKTGRKPFSFILSNGRSSAAVPSP